MLIWIVNPYGALPNEGWLEYRSAKLCRALANAGHSVVWWIADFEHRSKSRRSVDDFDQPSMPGSVEIVGVSTSAYYRNISLDRIRFEKSFGIGFSMHANEKSPPDLIVLGDPSLFYSKYVLEFASLVNARLVLDVIDLWPEMFHLVLPVRLSFLGYLFFYPLYRRREKLVQSASAVVAVAPSFLKKVKVESEKPQLVAYLGVDAAFTSADHVVGRSSNTMLEGFVADSELTVIFAGTFGDAYDFSNIYDLIERVGDECLKVKFIFVGDGPERKRLENVAEVRSNSVLVMGAMAIEELVGVYRYCDVGLCSYSKGSMVALPTKFYDCLGAGLAILTSLTSDLGEIVKSESIGRIYEPGDALSMYEQVCVLRSDKELLKDYKNNSIALSHRYSADSQYDEYVNFLAKLP
jgi:glycosyltransferase involved in cell wall biosynthesis